MNQFFINQRIKLRTGGRKAPKKSCQDLIKLIYREIINSTEEIIDYCLSYGFRNIHTSQNIYLSRNDTNWKNLLENYLLNTDYENNYLILSFFEEIICNDLNPKLSKDLGKIKFGWENYEIESIGLTTTGIPYIEAWAADDNEEPVGFYIYHDGINFRGYVPKKGNVCNLSTKLSIGNDDSPSIYHIHGRKISSLNNTELDILKKSDFYYVMEQIYPNDKTKLEPNDINGVEYERILSSLTIDFKGCFEDFSKRIETI